MELKGPPEIGDRDTDNNEIALAETEGPEGDGNDRDCM